MSPQKLIGKTLSDIDGHIFIYNTDMEGTGWENYSSTRDETKSLYCVISYQDEQITLYDLFIVRDKIIIDVIKRCEVSFIVELKKLYNDTFSDYDSIEPFFQRLKFEAL